jgi:predicted peroxiredoxin
MQTQFDILGATVTGRSHRLAGINNQDAFRFVCSQEFIAAVVCDGCGSKPFSEVGAQIGAQLVIEQITKIMGTAEGIALAAHSAEDFLALLRQGVLDDLRRIARLLGQDLHRTVYDYFLFTIAGFLLHAHEALVFTLGDGVVVINKEAAVFGRSSDNRPTYLGYGLLPPIQDGQAYMFTICQRRSLKEVDSLIIGSDGVEELVKIAGSAKFPDLAPLCSAILSADLCADNPDALRRALFTINRETAQLTYNENGTVSGMKKHVGRLNDDTTLVMVRRRNS